MYPYDSNVLPAIAASVTDVSHGIVLALSACFLLMAFAMLAGLVYSGILAGAIAVAAFVGIQAALRGPEFVDRVRVVNETPYLLDVEVTGNARDGWLKPGPVSPGETHNFGIVIDQGDEWIFHITTGPHDEGEFSVRKAELERARWDVAIPGEVQARLEAEGAVPRPRR
jgi:hypothetical protein